MTEIITETVGTAVGAAGAGAAVDALVLDQLPSAIVACDAAGTIRVANATAREWFGVEAEHLSAAWTGPGPTGFRHADGIAPLAPAALPLWRGLAGETISGLALTHVDALGVIRAVTVSGRPLQQPDGHPGGAVMQLSLVTAVEEAERQAQRARPLDARAIQLQRMESIGRLAGGVAHDFNNQLTVINGLLDLALSGLAADDPLAADLREARSAGTRAAGITRQLLAFSRQQVLGQEIADLNAIVRDLTKMLGRLLGDDIIIRVEQASSLHPIFVDVGQLEQVILNLAVNARDAMPRGGELRISTASERRDKVTQVEQGQLPPGAYAVLRIADQGSGMDERTRRQIFEPFFTTKALGHGTGLGLATVLGIVSQSNGGIVVESEVGVGSVFTVLIPASDQAGPRVTPPGGPAEPGVHRRTILIVDDEASLRTVGSKILQRAGYHVLTAAGAEEALATLAAHPGVVDLLLTDVVMPKMSGVELAAAIKPRYPTLKVLFTSGYTDDTIIRHGIDGAQVEFLPKPYSLSDLTKAVQRLMPDADAAAQ